MQKKTDRRVRKTKSQLKTGLAQLMREKSIREITVKELVDAVDINRSTFYLHYSDIPGLLAEVENEMMEEMQRAIREHPIDPGKDTVYYFIQDLFHVLDENRQIASALVGPHGDIGFVHKLEQLLEEKSRESLAALVPEKSGEMKYFYAVPCSMSQTLFGYSQNYEFLVDNTIYIFEAEKSCMQCYSYGIRNCVSLGSGSISIQQVKMLLELNPKRIIFLHDVGYGLENIMRNIDMVKNYSRFTEVELGYWSYFGRGYENKVSPSDLGKEWLENILQNEITMIGDEDDEDEL